MPAVDISICIANYNGGDLVLDCLSSVVSQVGDFRMEILVHDDASTDGSPDRISTRFPEIRMLAGSRNAGFCISNNRMVGASSGRFVLLLNNDAVLRPGSLQALLDAALDGREDCILGLPQRAMADGALVDRGYRTDPFLNPIPIMTAGTHEAGVATGACLWVPRATWDRIGGFPSWFESVAEDIFLCLAARLLGHRVFVLDGPSFDHWVGRNLGGGKLVDGELRTTVRRRKLSERNKTFSMLCCYPRSALWLLLPLHALSLAAEAGALAIGPVGASKAAQIYAGIPASAWKHRHDIANLRTNLMRQRPEHSAQLFSFTNWFPHKLRMLARHGRPTVD